MKRDCVKVMCMLIGAFMTLSTNSRAEVSMTIYETGVCHISMPATLQVSGTVKVKPNFENLEMSYKDAAGRKYSERSCGWLDMSESAIAQNVLVSRLEALDCEAVSFDDADAWILFRKGRCMPQKTINWKKIGKDEWQYEFVNDMEAVRKGRFVIEKNKVIMYLRKQGKYFHHLAITIATKHIESDSSLELCKKIHASWKLK